MISVNFKLFVFTLSLYYLGAGFAWAQLKTDKIEINQDSGVATISISFPTKIEGDLYLATPYAGQLYFFAENGDKFTTEVRAFKKDVHFQENQAQIVLKIGSQGVPPNVYWLYQVITVNGKSPLEPNNWIGDLSQLKLRINLPPQGFPFSPILPSNTPSVTATPVPVKPTATPVTPAPTQNPVSSTPSEETDHCAESKTNRFWRSTKSSDEEHEYESDECNSTPTVFETDGKTSYIQFCQGCHGSNPQANVNKILRGREEGVIQDAINKNKGGAMGVLKGRLNYDDIDAIANYLRTF